MLYCSIKIVARYPWMATMLDRKTLTQLVLTTPDGTTRIVGMLDLTRDAVYDALKARRVYATNGPRILLRVNFGGYPMGADVPAGERAAGSLPGLGPDTLVARVIAPGALERIDIVRSGEVVEAFDCRGERECAFGAELSDLAAGEYLYVRAVQVDGGAAWSSPFYFVE